MILRKLYWLVPMLGLVAGAGCDSASSPSATPAIEIADPLQTALNQVVSESPNLPAAALCVDLPDLELHWEGAAGLADPQAGIAMTTTTPVRLASNTKTFVAASVLRLAELDQLNLDDAIASHIANEHVTLLSGGGYDPSRITIRQLLTHTSGLYDYTASPTFNRLAVEEPGHRWSRTEQLQVAMNEGEPLGEPGAVFQYSDTGYILLGEILEHTTGLSMPEAVRTLVGFERLGLHSTWFESLEPTPEGLPARAHQLAGNIDNVVYDPSFDLYGGGGLTSTVGDLARFTSALFSDRIYRQPTTLEIMLAQVEGAAAPPDIPPGPFQPGAYRMGIWQAELGGHTVYRHTGFWGTMATYVVDLGATITLAVNQNQAGASMVELERAALSALETAAAKDGEKVLRREGDGS